ncbi:hypothetical protein N7448_011241 [Penicillium atrosanguineum]|nr:hypothetical protein N7448_011241 [Penicillium atrosanguineum]
MSSVRTSAPTQLLTCADPTLTSTSFLPLYLGMQETIQRKMLRDPILADIWQNVPPNKTPSVRLPPIRVEKPFSRYPLPICAHVADISHDSETWQRANNKTTDGLPHGLSTDAMPPLGHLPSGVGIAKSARHAALGHVQRVLHTLTALSRDAIDLPGHVTEDDMRPIPTETSSRHHSTFHRLAVPSVPYDTLFVHTIIHPTRALEHASAAITRDTRDGEAEAGTAGKSSDEKLDGAISVFDFSTLRQLSADQAQKCIFSPAVSSKTRAVS